MPTTDEILATLAEIASKGFAAAVVWHVVIALVVIALISGYRPTERTARAALPVMFLSVAVFAAAFGNPFNAIVFAVAAGALIALARSRGARELTRAPAWEFWAGGMLVIYGTFYPHFLGPAVAAYLYSAPVGLIPCPTLSVVIGFALIGNLGATNRAWGLVLAGLGLFYGLYGIFKLGVVLDAGLLAGAVVMAIATLLPRDVHAGMSARTSAG